MGKFWQIVMELPAHNQPIFSFLHNNLCKCQGILHKLGTCIDIKERSGLVLLMGKFYECLTELSAGNTVVAGYYTLKFLLYGWLFY